MTTLIDDLSRLGAELATAGLVQGAGGNLSARLDADQLLVTRSGAPLAALTPADFVTLGFADDPATWPALQPKPTSETAMHLTAYAVRPDTTVIIHVHPPQAIALGCLGRSLPALTPDFYLHLGLEVPLAAYVTPTTAALGEAITPALAAAPAVLLQNHGVLVTGRSLAQARLRLHLLEEAAAIYLTALPVGEPRRLSPADAQALDERTGGRYQIKHYE